MRGWSEDNISALQQRAYCPRHGWVQGSCRACAATFKRTVARHTEHDVLGALRALGPATAVDLCAHLHVGMRWMNDKLQLLLEAKLIHVCGSKKYKPEGKPCRIFAIKE